MMNNDSVYRCSRCMMIIEKHDYPASIVTLAYDSEGCERTEYHVCGRCLDYMKKELIGMNIANKA